MSSSNSVSVSYVDEVTYGVTPTPGAGVTLNKIRLTSEGLSADPITVESDFIRQDRMSSGQIVPGLEVSGDISFELARDSFFDKFFGLAMMNSWQAATSDVSSVSFTLDGSDDQRGDLAGTGVGTGISVGDILKVTSGSDDFVFQVIEVTDADNLVVACKKNQANFTGATSRRPAYIQVGRTQSSVTLAKAYEDVFSTGSDEQSQTYSGALVSGFSLSIPWGQKVTGSFSFMANGYAEESPSYQQQVATASGTVNDAPTALPISAIDLPLVTADGLATEFCIESLEITLDNGMTPQNCLGSITAKRFELGQAGFSLTARVYLGDQSYAKFQPAKIAQTRLSMAVVLMRDNGGYALVFPSLQFSFADPAAQGANQSVMYELNGVASIDATGDLLPRIYQL
jgi:hypothetical protein